MPTPDGSKRRTIPTAQDAVGEPDLVRRDGRVLPAYTGIERRQLSWRGLHTMDVTDLVD